MSPQNRPSRNAEAGQGLMEYVLILAPLSVLVALGIVAVVIAGSA